MRWARSNFLPSILVCLATVTVIASVARRTSAEELTFDSAGVPIHYVVEGEGEPVLLIHGFAVNHHFQWIAPKVVRVLSKDFQVIAFDNRGHGKSGKPLDPDAYGEEMVEDAIRLLDHLGIKKAHVCGYSLGGAITLKLISTHPDRVRSAVVGGMGWMRYDDERKAFQDELATSLEEGRGIAPLLQFLTPEGQETRSPSDVLMANVAMSLANDPKALAAVVRGMNRLEVTEDDLRSNEVPVLAIIGDRDPLKSQTFDAMLEVMHNVESRVIPEQAHTGTFFHPDFRASIDEFLLRHRTSAAKSVRD